MGEPSNVGKDKLLALDIDVIDVVTVDDKASADADEQVAFGAQLLADHRFDLSQLESEQTCLVVGLHQIAVVAVRRDEHDLFRCDTHQVRGVGDDQILLEHDEAKVAFCRRRKDTKNSGMYEMP